MSESLPHVPVLLQPALSALKLTQDAVVIDATYGRGGHSRAIVEQLGANGRLLAIDQDPMAIAHGQAAFAEDQRVRLCHARFDDMDRVAEEHEVTGQVSAVLMDLGVSSPQLDDPSRGFSFREDGPLDMRMDTTRGEPASAWLARVDEDELTRVLRDYGEERFARRIAREIVRARNEQELTGTAQLAAVVAAAAGPSPPERHPATRSFQAIRIHINDELGALERALGKGVDVLAPGGRFVVISFHSLEDRLVKQSWRALAKPPPASRRMPVVEAFRPRLKLVGGLVRPDAAEASANPRARSARMRVAEKLAEPQP